MDIERKIVYHFSNLTYPQQMKILVNLDLLENHDNLLSPYEFNKVIWARARVQDKMLKIWKMIRN